MSETTEATTTDTTTETTSTDDGNTEIDIFAVADDGTKQDGDGKPIMPDWLPGEQFWDKDKGEVRVQALATSWRDLRTQVSKGAKPGPAGAPPEKDTDYALPVVEGLPEGIVGGEKDTLLPAIRQAAHKAGVTQEQFTAMATPYLQQLAKNLKEHQDRTDPEAQRAQLRQEMLAELAKLGPNGKELALDVRGWLNGLEAAGKFAPDEVLALKAVSTAAGVRALAKIREAMGDKAVPVDGLDAEDGSEADARRILLEGHLNNDQATIAKAHRLLARLEKAGKLKL